MKIAKRSTRCWVLFAFLLFLAPAASAKGFSELLASFRTLPLPSTLDIDLDGDSGAKISIEDFESFFIRPWQSFYGSRPGLGRLAEWVDWIRYCRRFPAYRVSGETANVTIRSIGRVEKDGYILLSLYCYYEESRNPGNYAYRNTRENCFLFSFSGSGRLIDGRVFSLPRPRRISGAIVPSPEDVSLCFDAQKRIFAIERYGFDGLMDENPNLAQGELVAELGKREIGLASDGRFVDDAARQRFLLSSIYASVEDKSRQLRVYEADDVGEDRPCYLMWSGDPNGKPVEAEAEAGLSPSGALTARSLAGQALVVAFSVDRAGAVLTDASGKMHTLAIRYGSGENGEKKSISGMASYREDWRRYWWYLFAPTPSSVFGGSSGELLAARSYVLAGLFSAKSGWPDSKIEVGTLAKESTETVNGESVRFAPGSLFTQGRGYLLGRSMGELVFQTEGGAIRLPAGTAFQKLIGSEASWSATPPQSCWIKVKDVEYSISPDSTIRFYSDGWVEGIDFSAPVPLRVGEATVSVTSIGFSHQPYALKKASLAERLPVSICGTSTAIVDRITIDQAGNFESGVLQADTELAVGGRTLPFLGSDDPENDKEGWVQIYPGSGVRWGILASSARIQTPGSTVDLARGDSGIFRADGSMEVCDLGGMNLLSAGDAKAYLQRAFLHFDPDGRISPKDLPDDFKPATMALVVSSLRASCVDTRVRMRLDPDLKAETIGYLDRGDRVLVLARSAEKMTIEGMTDYWHKVRRLSDGLVGWSYGYYLKLGE